MNQGTSITDANSEQLKPLSNEQDILDLLNNAIFDCRNIETLLSNSKSSIFLPSILDDKHISSISISALQPDSFFLQWDYYDDLFYENHCQFVMKTENDRQAIVKRSFFVSFLKTIVSFLEKNDRF